MSLSLAGFLFQFFESAWGSFSILQLFALFLLGYLIYNTCILYYQRKRSIAALTEFPGPKIHWLYGDTYQKEENILNYMHQNSKIYHYACPFWAGPFAGVLYVTHPEYAKTVFTSSEPKNLVIYRVLIPWIGYGLLILSGQKWFQHRKMLTPAFHYDVLKPYVKLVSDSVNVLLVGADYSDFST
ncbi:cytochrome P450 4A24-like [Protopterus annectens]|uniref:cytochrome P450 4A24-like n=1 Tax=Protopterus annectens TaxID=7888 RepID=UPI001CFC06DB|nr:cytochrome P450 4A24-like [Protopterus annectens]